MTFLVHIHPLVRGICLILFCLLPATTLVYRDELGRWTQNKTCMAAPDEPSYFLMAQAIGHDGSIPISHIAGRDTFYPIGWPGLLALMSYPFGLTRFTAHAAGAVVLAFTVLQVYRLAQKMLGRSGLALLIAGVYASNWYVLDGSVFIFSEPAFTLMLLTWISLALARPDWPASVKHTALLTFLALLASAMRAAGIVCLATMLIYGGLYLCRGRQWKKLLLMAAIIAGMFVAYHAAIHFLSPERSLAAAANTDNSYSKQLLNGLTDHDYQKDGFAAFLNVPRVAGNLIVMTQTHLQSFAESLVPPIRETPRYGPYVILGKIMLLVAMFGCFITSGRYRFVQMFVIMYILLYILWPFDMIRFWSPILPLVLIFFVLAARDRLGVFNWQGSFRIAGVLLFLLLALNLQELLLKQRYWLRRLNYVSDTLASTAAAIHRDAGNGRPVVIAPGRDEAFSFAIYLNEPSPAGLRPLRYPLVPAPISPDQGQTLADCVANSGMERVYVVSYFAHSDIADALAALDPHAFTVTKIHQREIIAAAWRVEKKKKVLTGDTEITEKTKEIIKTIF